MAAIAIAALALAACSAPAQMILPGKLDLPVASGDRIKLCPDDGVEDTTTNSDCILTGAADAIASYEAALAKLSWKPGSDGGRKWWQSPPHADGARACVTITSHTTNAARREGAVLEFTIREVEPGASCAP